MRLYEITECAFPIDPSWDDQSFYQYRHGDLEVVVVRRPVEPNLRAFIEAQTSKLRLGVPRYRIESTTDSDRPCPGSILVRHSYETNAGPRYDGLAFFGLADKTCVFSVSGPRDRTDDTEQVLESFLRTFRRRGVIE